ncbi:MAG: cytochrome c maturation protein CcmE [Candidatus Latescibacterota bacterium]
MVRKKLRFGIGIGVVIVVLVVFAISGFEEGKAYYKTLDELAEMGEAAYGARLKVAGFVAEGSIRRNGKEVSFQLEQDSVTLFVNYVGSNPVPDTFKDGSEAVVEGTYRKNGTFEANKIQAKCASKYEAEYGKTDTDAH